MYCLLIQISQYLIKVLRSGLEEQEFIRTIIKNVFWNEDTEITNDGNGIVKADILKLSIPNTSMLCVLGKTYLEPKEWKKLEDKTKNFTFAPGDKIVKGVVEEDFSKARDIEEKFEYVYTLTKTKDNRYGYSEYMYHFYIEGK